MLEKEYGKSNRVLGLYTRLLEGEVINKAVVAAEYSVDTRSIQRDLEVIKAFLDNQVVKNGVRNTLVYDYKEKGHRLEHTDRMKFSNDEILAISKILLDSRPFTKKEMMDILDKLIECCVPKENQKLVNDLIANERYHYIQPQHNTVFIDKMWDIGQAIHSNHYIEISYARMKDSNEVKRKVKPVAILFSEFYFYLAAMIEDSEIKKHFDVVNDTYPTIYRIDRIKELNVLKEHFYIPYSSRFEEGEYRKRIQFMYGGKLQKIKFTYSGASIEAVLDRLPTAKILDEVDGVYTVSAEVFGKGIEMWLRSQGDLVHIL